MGNGKKLILVVEDEEPIRRMVSRELEAAGYVVVQAENGEKGLTIAKEDKPDLIVTDVLMPKLDGNQMIKAIREMPGGGDVRVLVVTARALMKDYFTMLDVDGFIEKPYKTEDLLKRVENILSKSKTAKDKTILDSIIEEDEKKKEP